MVGSIAACCRRGLARCWAPPSGRSASRHHAATLNVGASPAAASRSASSPGVLASSRCSWWPASTTSALCGSGRCSTWPGSPCWWRVFALGRTVVGRAALVLLVGPIRCSPRSSSALLRADGPCGFSPRAGPSRRQARLVVAGRLALVPAVLIVKQPDLRPPPAVPCVDRPARRRRMRLRILEDSSSWDSRRRRGVACAEGLSRRADSRLLDPLRDPLGRAYNVIQSKIAIGSGQLLGKGVPARHRAGWPFLPGAPHGFHLRRIRRDVGVPSVAWCCSLCYAVLLSRFRHRGLDAPKPVGPAGALGVTRAGCRPGARERGMVVG